MEDLLRGLALVAKGLRDGVSRASYSLGLGTLSFGCVLLFLDQGLFIVTEPSRWLVGVGALTLGARFGRQLEARRSIALLPASDSREHQVLPPAHEHSGATAGLEQLAHELASELAKVANDAEGAKTMAKRAGFPSEHLPELKTAIGFWTNIVEQAMNGRGSLLALAKEAVEQFPNNSALRAHEQAIEERLAQAYAQRQALEA